MKKMIYFFGGAFLAIVIILNILYTANLDASEHITIELNKIPYILGIIIGGIALYMVAKIAEKYLSQKLENIENKEKIKKRILIIAIVLYAIFNIVWVVSIRTYVIGDQAHVANLAQALYGDHTEEILNSQTYAEISLREYVGAYSQQIPTAFVFSIFFRILHFDIMELLRILNIISNVAIIIALYKISNQLSKSYSTNKVLLGILSLTFFSIPMLATFVYGDTPSLACCLFSVYFMMKYHETEKIKNVVFSATFMMVAYMLRMNSLIFIIATVIYMILSLCSKMTKKTVKEKLLKVSIIILYLVISMLPANLIKNYYLHKFGLDKTKTYPSISYFLMAMEESPRANGWYHEQRGEYVLKNIEKAKEEYKEELKNRVNYLSQNLDYTFHFYIDKVSSMWTENTYSAIRNNTIGGYEFLETAIAPLTFYQKILLLLTCLTSLIVLIQNKKNLSLDVVFLITIFIGGFAFHVLWEAKSRYIIPYTVVLIPVASIKIRKMKIAFLEDSKK